MKTAPPHTGHPTWDGPEHRYFVLRTGDGSPTVAHARPGASVPGEPMHSSMGAWAETDYVYGHALRFALERGWPRRLLVVGLGLGYVEARAAAIWAADTGGTPPRGTGAHPRGATDTCILSFESDLFLREALPRWLADPTHTRVPEALRATYADVFAREGAAAAGQLRAFLASGAWRLVDALHERALTAETQHSVAFGAAAAGDPADTQQKVAFTVIAFDAYSGNTSPDLWDEAFLGRFLDRFAAPECVLATYAFKGALRRALESRGFTVERRPGFGAKRECTLAWRVGGA
ncbi:MAG: hypothetical protein IT285_05995 [Bdellovibrionales bacterium]|nr:hypothetical protein [Bdellovibrionales bacterium]